MVADSNILIINNQRENILRLKTQSFSMLKILKHSV